jgi:hypothetical protein
MRDQFGKIAETLPVAESLPKCVAISNLLLPVERMNQIPCFKFQQSIMEVC